MSGFIPIKNTNEYLNEEGYKIARVALKGTPLVCCIGSIGKYGVAEQDVAFNQQINAVIFNDVMNNKFGLYHISCQEEQHWFYANGNVVQILNTQNQGKLLFTCPPKDEQERIADYLDKKCEEIDKVVETEKAVIGLLKEYKQSVITEAVTKGLDKSVPLKDSGIEWIGKIPQHWKIEKLKFISECNKEVLSENTESSKTIDYIEIGSVTNENGINDHQTFTFENAPSRARRIVKHGDTIISTVRTYLKAIAYIDEQYDNYICSTGFAVFTPSSKILPKFLFHALHSEWFVSTVEANSVGISYPAINTTNIVNYKIAIPSVKEQEQILKYLDKKCSEIDKAITGKEQLIEKLTEYKKSLIYECVTGKRKVAD